MMSESELLLEVRDLEIHFYTYAGVVKALDKVSFTIKKGEWFGLVGETGCGKSVTSLGIMRLVAEPGEIIGGEVHFEGRNLLEIGEKEMRKVRGLKIGMIFQDPSSSLNPVYRVGSQLLETIKAYEHHTKSTAFDRAVELFKLVGIPSPEQRLREYPHEFSGGMQQRAMIAMSLSGDPDLLIADEPTTALDVTIQAQILDLMKDLQTRYNTAVLLITHDLGIIAETCDRVGVMYAGRIIELADVITIFKDPMHPYTKGLVNAIPKIHVKKDLLEVIKGNVPDLIDPPMGCRFHPRCPRNMEGICTVLKPRELEVEPGHMVACHLFDEDVVKK